MIRFFPTDAYVRMVRLLTRRPYGYTSAEFEELVRRVRAGEL